MCGSVNYKPDFTKIPTLTLIQLSPTLSQYLVLISHSYLNLWKLYVFGIYLEHKMAEKKGYLNEIHNYFTKTLKYQYIPVLVTGVYTVLIIILLAFQSVRITQLEKRTIGSVSRLFILINIEYGQRE